MSKKELLVGTVITIMVIFCLFSLGIDAVSSPYIPEIDNPIIENEFIWWFLSFNTVVVMVIVIWSIGKSYPKVDHNRFSIKAIIPWYYIVSLIPIETGISISVITGNINWMWLSCLSIPTLFVLLLITFKKMQDKKSGKESKGE
jgi:hypothetical protein